MVMLSLLKMSHFVMSNDLIRLFILFHRNALLDMFLFNLVSYHQHKCYQRTIMQEIAIYYHRSNAQLRIQKRDSVYEGDCKLKLI